MTARPLPEVSVVIPLFDEEESVGELVAEVARALGDRCPWELILVDDCSSDGTVERAREAFAREPRGRLLRLARRYGQSTAMQAGFDHARGRVVVSLDGDLQNDPADIPRMIAALGDDYDISVGYRVRRQDHLVRKVPSWIANRLIRWMTGVPIRDSGCSLKAYRGSLLRRFRLYSDMHRFIPALAVGVAGARVVEVPVHHRARAAGVSKYGMSRVFRVTVDLLTLKMVHSFRLNPFTMFALGALVALLLGGVSAAASVLAWLTFRPADALGFVLPGVTVLWFSLAGFLLSSGLLAQAVVQVREAPTARWSRRARR